MINLFDLTTKEMVDLYRQHQYLRKFAYDNHEDIMRIDDPYKFFAVIGTYYSPSQYGIYLQRYMANEIGGLKKLPKDDYADHISLPDGIKVKFKSTLRNVISDEYNILNINVLSDADYYCICAVDMISDLEFYIFLITKKEMTYIIQNWGRVMRQKDREYNAKYSESKFSMKHSDEVWNYMMQNHLVSSFKDVGDIIHRRI